MNDFRYLKNSFLVYIVSGILLGLAVFSLVALHRYNNFLKDSFDTVKDINLKEEDVRKEIDRIDALASDFRNSFGIQEEGINPEKLILHSLDEMKMHLNYALVTVSRFESTAGERRLPVEMRIPVSNYRSVIDSVGYIESFRLPDFRIKTLSLSREQVGGVVLSIQGSFVVPEGRSSL
jgi:hypothetical protein